MPNDRVIVLIILTLALAALSFVFFVNINNNFEYLADPLVGDGLGTLCSSETDCKNFCSSNRGRCNEYCRENPSNNLCNILFDYK